MPIINLSIDRRSLIISSAAAGAGYVVGARSFAGGGASVLPRKEASKLEADPAEMQVLRDAVAILKAKDGATPAIDGWAAIADPHVLHCFNEVKNEIHFGWWFLPWHRAYLIAMERRLQRVVGEPKLRLPYWDWYTVDQIPEAFARATYTTSSGEKRDNPLFDATRARGPADRTRFTSPPFASPDNERITRRVLGNTASELDLLRSSDFGDIGGSPGGPAQSTTGGIEGGPHGSIHIWVAGSHESIPGLEGGNMAQAFSPRDPVFLLHHGNIDRLWTAWRNLTTGGPHNNPTEAAWLERKFALPNAEGSGMEEYKVADMLDTTAFGYSYDRELGQMTATAAAAAAEPPGATRAAASAAGTGIVMNTQPLDVSGGIAKTETRSLAGPAAAAARSGTSGRVQAGKIVLGGVTLPPNTVSFAVYVSSPKFTQNTDENLVATGTILNPTGKVGLSTGPIDIVLPIPERVVPLIAGQENVSFTIVASGGSRSSDGPAAAAARLKGLSIKEVRAVLP